MGGRLRTIESIYEDYLKRREGLINALTDSKLRYTQPVDALGSAKIDNYCF
jgi:hypothetical protein